MTEDVKFILNGKPVETKSDKNKSLLQFLRWEKGLTGAKEGCGKAQCGTCTILLNGHPTKSCSIKLSSSRLVGAEVVTIEGLLNNDGSMHPI